MIQKRVKKGVKIKKQPLKFAAMISAVFLINQKGEIIIYRLYRDDVALSAANLFRVQVIAAKEAGAGAPVKSIEGSTFMYIRHKDMYFVAVSRGNANAGVWHPLQRIVLTSLHFLRLHL